MEDTVAMQCLFLPHLETMVKADEDQMTGLGVVTHAHHPSSWEWRQEDSQCEGRLRDSESTNRQVNDTCSRVWWGRGRQEEGDGEGQDRKRHTQRVSNDRTE